jgi:signal transduction histidine kinase
LKLPSCLEPGTAVDAPPASTTILLVEDDEDDYLITRDLLSDVEGVAYQLTWLKSYEEGVAEMKRNAHDVYLVDFRLAGADGLELIREARAQGCVGPIILMTGQGDRQTDLKAMHAGASDFLTKGRIECSQLERSIRYAIEQHRMRNEMQRHAEALARSNAELQQFAYVASHDLQEPLRTISSYVQLLQRRYQSKLDSDANEFIGFAVEGARRMQTLINDLLSLSRVGTRGRDLQPTDCGEALEESLANLQAAVTESGAEVTHDPLPIVVADKPQRTQLFQNLVGNAIKFNSGQTPKVHVFCRPNGKECVIGVRDNGIGIDQRHAERIFQVFQRLHDREKYAGTGIGLAICKKIVERHGGRIWVESQPGEGATFLFNLSQAEVKAEANAESQGEAKPEGKAEAKLEGAEKQ